LFASKTATFVVKMWQIYIKSTVITKKWFKWQKQSLSHCLITCYYQ